MSVKWLYKFKTNRTETKTETKKTKGEDGKEVSETITETIEKPITIAFQKPKRRLYEDADLFHSVKLSEGIKAGLLTKHLIAKRYDNDGGLFSDEEREEYATLILLKTQKIREYQNLSVNSKDKQKNEEVQASILDQLTKIEEQIQTFEQERSSLFEKTADQRAENQLVMWWVFHLSYFSDKENPSDDDFNPVFGYGSFDDRMKKYDEFYDEEDKFWLPLAKKLAFLTSFWYSGNIKDEDSFKAADRLFEDSLKEELEAAKLAENKEEEKVQESKE